MHPPPSLYNQPSNNNRRSVAEEGINRLSVAEEGKHKVIATARGVYDHKGGTLTSEETGVSIVIPPGAITKGAKQEIYFKVCQDNSLVPPLDQDRGQLGLGGVGRRLFQTLATTDEIRTQSGTKRGKKKTWMECLLY